MVVTKSNNKKEKLDKLGGGGGEVCHGNAMQRHDSSEEKHYGKVDSFPESILQNVLSTDTKSGNRQAIDRKTYRFDTSIGGRSKGCNWSNCCQKGNSFE